MAIPRTTESFLPSDLDTSQFTLQNDQSLFTILRKNIYSNVILAGIRELSTNAIDACIEADLDVNWEVHIPTLEEPFFAIRDYGPGMTLDFLQGDFTVIGASSKRNSNKVNGQFGLGRLSPLAYTSSFTIESWNSGMYYSYLISLQDGIPCAIQLTSYPSLDPSGCRFTYSVDPSDIQSFYNEASKLYKYFTYKPNSINIDLPLPAITVDTDYYMITDDNAGIVMANVYYPFNRQICCNYRGLILKVPTGTVSLTPGRESLNYDDTTVTYLNEQVELAEEDIIDTLNTTIQQASTEWEQAVLYVSLLPKVPWSFRSSLINPCQFIKLKSSVLFPTIIGKHLYKSYYRDKACNLLNNSKVNTDDVFTDGKILLVDTSNYTHVYSAFNCCLYIIKPKDLELAKQQLTALGIPFILTSSFEVPAVESPIRSRKTSITLQRINSTTKLDYDPSMGTIYYVPYKGTSPKGIGEYSLLQFINHYTPNITVYGIAESNLSKIKGNINFISFYDYLTELSQTQSLLAFKSVDTCYLENCNLLISDKNPLTILRLAAQENHALLHYSPCYTWYRDEWSFFQSFITIHVYDYKHRYSLREQLDKYPLIRKFDYTESNTLLHYLNLEHFYETHLPKTEG